jgi:hypothetical protein
LPAATVSWHAIWVQPADTDAHLTRSSRIGVPPEDREALLIARTLLESPSFATRLSSIIGTPIEQMMLQLPDSWSRAVGTATRHALEVGLKTAVSTLDDRRTRPSANLAHKLLVAASGAGGGALGLAGLPLELPLSTVMMLRSVADIARSQGENLKHPETQLACLSVFALGGGKQADTGYFGLRSSLAHAIAEAAEYVARRGLLEEGAPVLLQLLGRIAARFGMPVSQKLAAQMLPLIGAATGATINWMFMDHYQGMARGHFTVRRLERTYGCATIRELYEQL